MVVSLDDAEKNAKLSLRQTEILGELNGVCSDLSDEADEKWALFASVTCGIIRI